MGQDPHFYGELHLQSSFAHEFVGSSAQRPGYWTFSGITVAESGFALSPGISGSCLPGLAIRPNCIGNVAGPKTVAEFFNTAAFAPTEFGFIGSCGEGIIRGPGEFNWSWSLYKTFPLGERAKLQFRTEFFNVFNHPSFLNLSTALETGNFGQVTSALDPREIEFALRFDF